MIAEHLIPRFPEPMAGWKATGLTYELDAVRGTKGNEHPAKKMVALMLQRPIMVKPGGRKRKLVPALATVFRDSIEYDAWTVLSGVWSMAGCEVAERPRAWIEDIRSKRGGAR